MDANDKNNSVWPNALDATSNAPDEWPTISKTETVEWEPCQKTISIIHLKLVDVAGDLMGGYRNDHELQIFQHGMATQVNVIGRMVKETAKQAEEREREEVIENWRNSPYRKERFHMIDDPKKFGEFYDWLKSTDQLKDKSDE